MTGTQSPSKATLARKAYFKVQQLEERLATLKARLPEIVAAHELKIATVDTELKAARKELEAAEAVVRGDPEQA